MDALQDPDHDEVGADRAHDLAGERLHARADLSLLEQLASSFSASASRASAFRRVRSASRRCARSERRQGMAYGFISISRRRSVSALI
jgi:hypothetical protein